MSLQGRDNLNLIIPNSGICWSETKSKSTNSPVYLNLENVKEKGSIKVSVFGFGGPSGTINRTYHSNYYVVDFGKKYILWNKIFKNKHTGVKLRFLGNPGQTIIGKWSPDYINEKGVIPMNKCQETPPEIQLIKNPIKFIDVPIISQKKEMLPTGCESVSAVMVLQYYKINITPKDFINNYLDKLEKDGDPDYYFIGSPNNYNALGCFSPAIAISMNKILDNGLIAKVIKNKTINELCHQYIDKGTPVLIWTTIDLLNSYSGKSWIITDSKDSSKIGTIYTWPCNEHCLVLIGYNNDDYFVNDPWKPYEKVRGAFPKSLLENRFEQMGSQAVIIEKIDQTNILQGTSIYNEIENFRKTLHKE